MPNAQNEAIDVSPRPWEGLPPETAAVLRPALAKAGPEIIDAIRAGVPAYARPLEGGFGEAVRRGVAQALGQFAEMVERPGTEPAAGRSLYRELGRGEAREGRSLDALLAAYRIGARLAWRRCAEAAQRAELDPDVLTLLAEAIFAYIDELSAESAEGHAKEQSAAAGEAERRRRALIALLLGRPAPDAAILRSAAREAGWEVPEGLAALAWPGEGPERVSSRLPAGTIVAPADELRLALVPDAGAPGRRAELERAVGARPSALGPLVEWTDAARSADRAVAVCRLAVRGRIGGRGLVATDDHLADLIVHGDESVLDELALRRLGPLDALPGRVRERLSETLLAWLEHHGRLREVADALYVHPQTVRYRVGQLRDALGDDLDDPRARFELELALRGRRDGVQGHAATEPAEVDGLGSTAEPSTAARLSESGPAGADAR